MFKSKSGFTLAEMMVVMLILSIVLAAMAPVMTTRNKTDYSSPWRYASNGSDAYFAGNANSNQVAMIGQHEVGTTENNARLILRTSSGSGWSHLMFKTGDTIVGRLYLDESNLYLSNATNPSGSESTSVGVGALTQNTGESNTAIGNEALHNNTSGIMNTAIGAFSLRESSTGENNVGVGTFSLNKNTTGSGNVAIGTYALQHNTTGTDNIAIGTNASSEELTYQVAKTISLGYQSSATGNGSIAIGSSMTSGEQHGYYELNGARTIGIRSIAIGNGAQAGYSYSSTGTSTDAIAIGPIALASPSYTIALGRSASSLGGSSIAIGYQAQAGASSGSTMSGSNTISIGTGAQATSDDSIAIGNGVHSISQGSIAIGKGANANGTSGTVSSIAIGYGSQSGRDSTAIGDSATATGDQSMAIGYNTTASTQASTAIGYLSTASNGWATAIGYNATASGVNSIAIGFDATAKGTNNIAIGNNACKNVTGSNKVCIGADSGPLTSDSFATNSNNIIYLGSSDTTVYIPGNLVVGQNAAFDNNIYANLDYAYRRFYYKGLDDDPVYNGHFGTSAGTDNPKGFSWYVYFSDRSLKYVGKENTEGLDKIRQLKVFNYTFKKDEKKTPHVGVIAQDLQKVFPNAVKKGVDGFLTIRMEDMFYAVINAIKELDSRVTRLEKENQELKARIERLEAKVK